LKAQFFVILKSSFVGCYHFCIHSFQLKFAKSQVEREFPEPLSEALLKMLGVEIETPTSDSVVDVRKIHTSSRHSGLLEH